MATKLFVITHCAVCPFFEDSPLKKVGGIFTAALLADTQYGLCNILPSGEFLPIADLKLGLPSGPAREAEEPRFAKARSRRVIENKKAIPDDCPLRQADMTLTITIEN